MQRYRFLADLVVYADYSISYGRIGDVIIAPMPRVRSALQPSSIISTRGHVRGGAEDPGAAMPALGSDNVLFLAGKRTATDMARAGRSMPSRTMARATRPKWSYMLHSGVPGELLTA